MARIRVIEHEESEGQLKTIYDELIQKRGKLAEVHKIQSLRPQSIVKHMDLYMEIMFSKSDLSRAQREMIAVVVSAKNQCSYCQVHHVEALKSYWKNDDRVIHLKNNFRSVELSAEDHVLCEYAEILTLEPEKAEETNIITPLKNQGFSDEAILDATLVVSYFNFVNRLVLALNVKYTAEEKSGYKY